VTALKDVWLRDKLAGRQEKAEWCKAKQSEAKYKKSTLLAGRNGKAKATSNRN